MQEALESIFGPGVGLIGFVIMFIILWPKIRARWRGFRARQKGPVDCRERRVGLRALELPAEEAASRLSSHPEHGAPVDLMTADYPMILLETICWCLPLAGTLLFISPGQYSLRMLCLVVSIFLAFVGILNLMHLGDKVAFYRTGAVIRLKFKKLSLDYNSIVSFTERTPLIPWLAPGVILHLDDDRLVVLDGFYLTRGRRLKPLLSALPERISHSAASEKLIQS